MSRSRLTNVDDLSALSDAQLGELMGKHRRPDGAFELPVNDDWATLSKEDRISLAKRLQAITTGSAPLDLEKLDALLQHVSKRDDVWSRAQPQSGERETESPPDEREIYKRDEIEAHDNLVKDGGRPLYPIDLLESVSENPNAHYRILQPFWRKPRLRSSSEGDHFYPHDVFRRQWFRWQSFRNWQRDNRRIDEEDDRFPAFVEVAKRHCIEIGDLKGAAEIEADPECLKQKGSAWYYIQRHRKWQRHYQRELGCDSLSSYQEALKARLSRHGFARTIQLHEDPKRQDRLTDWIEYLGFEYWWLDRYTASVGRLKEKHDNFWEEIRRLGILRDDETPEFVRTSASAMQRQAAKDNSWQAVQDAESEAEKVYKKTQKDPDRVSISKQQRIRMMVDARKKLLSARKAHDFNQVRSNHIVNFVRETYDYIEAKEDVAYQKNLLEWAVQEADKIEAEQKYKALAGRSQKKRKLSVEDVTLGEPNAKRQRLKAQEHELQPSNDKLGTRGRRALRKPQQSPTEQIFFIEAELNPTTSESISKKKCKASPRYVSLLQSKPKNQKPSAQRHSSQQSNERVSASIRTTRNRLGRDTRGKRLAQGKTKNQQDTDSERQRPLPKVSDQEPSKGLRRSSRLAARRLGAEFHSQRNANPRYQRTAK